MMIDCTNFGMELALTLALELERHLGCFERLHVR